MAVGCIYADGGTREEITTGTLEDTTPGTRDDSTPGTMEDTTPGTLKDSTPGTMDDTTPGTRENSTTGTRKTALYIMYNNILFVNKCKEIYVFCIKTLNNNLYITFLWKMFVWKQYMYYLCSIKHKTSK